MPSWSGPTSTWPGAVIRQKPLRQHCPSQPAGHLLPRTAPTRTAPLCPNQQTPLKTPGASVSTPSFRDYLFAPDHPRVADIRGLNAREYAEAAKTDSFAGPMIEGWQKLYPQPFTGITNDGVRREGLYPLTPVRPGEEAPPPQMVAAACKLLGAVSAEQAHKLTYAVDAPEWQSWANPEFMQHDTGLRLDEL